MEAFAYDYTKYSKFNRKNYQYISDTLAHSQSKFVHIFEKFLSLSANFIWNKVKRGLKGVYLCQNIFRVHVCLSLFYKGDTVNKFILEKFKTYFLKMLSHFLNI